MKVNQFSHLMIGKSLDERDTRKARRVQFLCEPIWKRLLRANKKNNRKIPRGVALHLHEYKNSVITP